MKKLISLIIITALLLCGCAEQKQDNGKIKIVATNFSCYDFARAVAGDSAEITMLIPPAADIHSFEPTALDISNIIESDLFIFVGGESDTWVKEILKNTKTSVLNFFEEFNLTTDEHSYHIDEHIWTSPEYAKKQINFIKDCLGKIDEKNKEIYQKNAENYIAQIEKAEKETKDVIAASKHNKIVIADRFPLKYFAEYYGLSVTAAFSACDHETDIDLNTAAHLLETVKNNNLSSVFVTELGNTDLAEIIKTATGCQILTLHSAQNISAEDFKNGVTYVTLMKRNAEALEKGLNLCR